MRFTGHESFLEERIEQQSENILTAPRLRRAVVVQTIVHPGLDSNC